MPMRAAWLMLLIVTAPVCAEQPLWEAGIGVAALRMPGYRGSDRSSNWLLPAPYLVYRGAIFRADREGARAVLVDAKRFDFDLSLAASPPTKSDDDPARDGMDDIAPTVEVGPRMNFAFRRGSDWNLGLRVPLRAVITVESKPKAVGWALTPALAYDTRVAGFEVGVLAGPMWGSRKLHAYSYDVPARDATARRPAYRAASGFGGWQLTGAASRRIGRAWIGAFVRADSVAGAVFDDSPLVRQRHTFSAGVALSWIFAVSDEQVADRR